MCGCAVGTIKSRVNRARVKLSEMLGVNEVDEAVVGEPIDHGPRVNAG
jgi:RNA polymerase sigma-70 factor (ECF subfamily)